MKNYMFTFIVCAFSMHAHAQINPADSIYIDSIFKKAYPANEPGVVVLIAEKGKPVFASAYGMANMELDVPNQLDYKFAIGSMSKQFTAVAILQLAEKGLISLDDDITKHLPDYNSQGYHITIRQLLNHTCGIPSFTEVDTFVQLYNKDLGKQEILNLFMNEPLLFPPGTNWSYSNSGYTVAGMILEKVTGQDLGSYLQENIFSPLGMTNTIMGDHSRIMPGMVTGYEPSNNGYAHAREFSWTWPFAAGGIVSNVENLNRWNEALYTNKILSEKSIAAAFHNYTLDDELNVRYGLGWSVDNYQGIPIIRHGGAINGFLSEAVRIPSNKMYIVVLSNNASKGPGGYVNQVLNYLYHFGIEDTTVFTAYDGKEYEGVYQIQRSGSRLVTNYSDDTVYRYITADATGISSQVTGGSKQQLVSIGKDTFMLNNPYSRYVFMRNDEGTVDGIKTITLPSGYGPDDISVKTTLPLPAEKVEIELSNEVLVKYLGKYDFGGGFQIEVTVDGQHLYAQATGQAMFEIFAKSENTFFYKIVDATIEFMVEEEQVTGLILHQGASYNARKIE